MLIPDTKISIFFICDPCNHQVKHKFIHDKCWTKRWIDTELCENKLIVCSWIIMNNLCQIIWINGLSILINGLSINWRKSLILILVVFGNDSDPEVFDSDPKPVIPDPVYHVTTLYLLVWIMWRILYNKFNFHMHISCSHALQRC